MLVGFEFIWDETPLLVEVAKKLNERGTEIVGVTLGNRWCSLLRNCKIIFDDFEKALKNFEVALSISAERNKLE